jgi:hypothetical protein
VEGLLDDPDVRARALRAVVKMTEGR